MAKVAAAEAAVPVQKAALADAIAANASGAVEPAADRFAADPLKSAEPVAATPVDKTSPVLTTGKAARTETPVASAEPAPAVPTPNPNAPVMENPSDSVVALPPVKKKPWWKIIGE